MAPGRLSESKILAYTKKPHLLCLSETWLKPETDTPNFLGYKTIFRKDRQNGAGGGLLTLARDDIKCEPRTLTMPQNTRLEAQAIDVYLAHDKMSLLHIYNPETNLNSNHLDFLVNQLSRKFLIVGDFNGHHSMWDPNIQHTNQCGRVLADYILDTPNIALATSPGLKTYMCARPPFNSSTLDLTLCSNNLIQITETSILGDSGSDHLPVRTKVQLAPDLKVREKRKKWKIIESKITLWQSKLHPTETTSDDIDVLENEFTKSLIEAAESTFRKTSGQIKTKYNKPWWTSECSRAVAQRRRAKRRAERRPTIANIIELRRTTAKAKRTIKKTKRETWRKFCESVTSETPTKQIWDMVKKLNGVKTYNTIPLKENGATVFDNQRKAEILADSLDELLGEEPQQITIQQRREIEDAKIQQTGEGMNTRFTMKELKDCISNIENNKATGEDEVINNFLKNLPSHKMTELLSLINKSWRTSKIPNTWKNALVIPIHKPGKDNTDPRSYRPISLLSCVGKVAERLVNTRLQWHMEKTGSYSPTQYGFRPGRSTEDPLVNFDNQIRSSLVNRKVTVAVFFDLKNAFDTINHDHILLKLTKAGIKGNMLSWIQEFLHNRTFQMLVGNSKSDPKYIKRGVPQGSCLSPTLFNIIMSDIPHTIRSIIWEYADDIALICTADSLEEAIENIQLAITELETWANRWCLRFNTNKTKCLCFTKKRIGDKLQRPDFQLKLNQDDIEWVKHIRYLGVTLDAPTLTWKKHYQELVREGQQRINIMRAISGTSWGANRELLLNFYRTYIRSKISYAATATASACQTRKESLEKIQNAALRVALGARKTSPIPSLQVEANMPPLLDHLESLCILYYHRMTAQATHNPHIAQLEEDEDTQDKLWNPSAFKKPLIRKIPDIARSMQIPIDLHTKSAKIPSTPPWQPSTIALRPDLIQETNKEDSNERKKALALETIHSLYPNHTKLYTDGSKIQNSTSAGLWIPHFNHRENWKFDHGQARSIMSAELYAIDKGLTWLLLHKEVLPIEQVVILTDSRSGIEALNKSTPKYQSHRIDTIKKKAQDLRAEANIEITIQWIPSHVGIEGNEEADETAKRAHENLQEVPIELDPSEVKFITKVAQHNRWQLVYDTKKQDLHIGDIKPVIEKWPWTNTQSRQINTAMTRLRLGHSGLNQHLHRFNMAESQDCNTCGVPETVAHFLTTCTTYAVPRARLMTTLNKINIVQPDHKILLGSGNLPHDHKVFIANAVGNFLRSTGRLGTL